MADYEFETFHIPYGEAVVAKKNNLVLGVEVVRNINLPLLPERWKAAIQGVRLHRAEAKAATSADETIEVWNQRWIMGVSKE